MRLNPFERVGFPSSRVTVAVSKCHICHHFPQTTAEEQGRVPADDGDTETNGQLPQVSSDLPRVGCPSPENNCSLHRRSVLEQARLLGPVSVPRRAGVRPVMEWPHSQDTTSPEMLGGVGSLKLTNRRNIDANKGAAQTCIRLPVVLCRDANFSGGAACAAKYSFFSRSRRCLILPPRIK